MISEILCEIIVTFSNWLVSAVSYTALECLLQKLQRSHVKTFKFFFYCLTSIFFVCYVFVWQILMCLSLSLSSLTSKCTFHANIYIPMESSNLSLTKYAIIMWRKRQRKKLSFNCYKEVIFFPFFPLFWV